MQARRWIVAALAVTVLSAACGSPATSPGASPFGSGRPLPSLGPLGPSPEALAERDERVWAQGLEVSGAKALLGPGLAAWLDDQRHAFVDAVLEEGGILADGRVASVEPRGGLTASRTALGGSGMTLAMTGAFLREFTSSYTPGRNGPSQQFTLPHSETHETEIDGRRATVQLSIALDFHFSGARVDGTVSITITTTIFDANGRAVGTITVVSASTVEMEVCPDIDGGLNGHFATENEVMVTGVAAASAGSYRLETSGVATGQVNDDAFLTGLRVTGEASQRSSGAGTREVDAAVHLDVRSEYSTPGDVGSLHVDESSISEDVTRGEETATNDDITRLDIEILGTGVIVASLVFEAAQAKWRNGYCVRIEATELSRLVSPREVVDFTAKVFHNFDGSELDQPIIAALSGVASVDPLTKQDPPAAITYTAGPAKGDIGTVKLETTSKRGIAKLEIRFEVNDLVLRLEIESEIKITTALAISGHAGTAKVSGYIDLEKDETSGRWSGTGDLTATTTSGPGGCNAVTIEGNGVAGANHYDWVVRESLIDPGSRAFDVYMDNGAMTNETPDITTVHLCPGGPVSGNTNTWENAFFVAHHFDYELYGLHLVDWRIVATDQTWLTGGLVADNVWTDNCTGPQAVEQKTGVVLDCIGTTHFWLRLLPRPAP